MHARHGIHASKIKIVPHSPRSSPNPLAPLAPPPNPLVPLALFAPFTPLPIPLFPSQASHSTSPLPTPSPSGRNLLYGNLRTSEYG